MFTAHWYGVGFNYGSLSISGDTTRYTIEWSDGPRTVLRTDQDGDGDPHASTSAYHIFSSDGTYDIAVLQNGVGVPPVRLRAYMYSNATNDLSIGGTALGDMMTGGSGADTFRGGAGDDTLASANGNDRLYGGDGDDFLLGGQGDDLVYGGNDSDLIAGNEGVDRLYGDAGRDYIYGDDGNDLIHGGDGDDYFSGGIGLDRLWGDAGSDTFVFAPGEIDGVKQTRDLDRDLVMDYQQGTDNLDVNQWFSGGFGFIGTSAFSRHGTGEVRYEIRGSETFVFGDIDGNGSIDFGFRIQAPVTLQATDFGIYSA